MDLLSNKIMKGNVKQYHCDIKLFRVIKDENSFCWFFLSQLFFYNIHTLTKIVAVYLFIFLKTTLSDENVKCWNVIGTKSFVTNSTCPYLE